MNTFGPRLRVLREGKGMDRQQLADAIHSSPAYISQLENQFRRPGLETAVKLATALEVSLEELLHGAPLQVPVAALVQEDVAAKVA